MNQLSTGVGWIIVRMDKRQGDPVAVRLASFNGFEGYLITKSQWF